MKTAIIFISGLIVSFSAMADQVVNVYQSAGWVDLPYCGGQTRISCDQVENALANGHCTVEFKTTTCLSISLYTNSTFYPSVWTVKDIGNAAGTKKIVLDNNRMSGFEEPYFYSFLHTEGNDKYLKIKYQMK